MYTIHPIKSGTLTSPKNALTYKHDPHTDVVFPTLSFLLQSTDDGPTVLIDTGVRPREDPYIERRGKIVGPPYGGPEPVRDGLAEYGLGPADVDTVILTHLHHDHVGNVNLFPDVRFVCQREEWETARDPLPLYVDSYPDVDVDWLADNADLDLVDGETDLAPGITLVPTPGHTEGSQSVIVETSAGPHALIADLAYNQHNLDPGRDHIIDAAGRYLPVTPRPDLPYIPPGTLVDIPEAYDSIERIRDRVGSDGAIIPGHDPEYAPEYPE
ncbi:MAG: N-acyl homoserine lactonase family protein [Salinirussus sp.]